MRLENGKMSFEDGDRLRVKDDALEEMLTLIAVDGCVCDRCEFYPVCDRGNRANLMAGFCTDTHFEITDEPEGTPHDKG